MATTHTDLTGKWTPLQKIALRFSFLFFVLQSFPLQPSFYRDLFHIKWASFVPDIFNLATYTPHFFDAESTLLDWLLIAIVSVLGAFLWRKTGKFTEDTLFYYLRVLIRFRLAAALLTLGFIKFFPLFAPEPSLSHLNTGYGYFAHWKHLYLSLGVAPAYLSFLGTVELITAFLLLFRKTSFLSVVFIIPFYGNVLLANFAYEGKGYVFVLFLLSLSFVLFLYDFRRFISLVVFHKQTNPAFLNHQGFQRIDQRLKRSLKLGFALLFIGFYGGKTYALYADGSNLYYPQTLGIANIEGLYHCSLYVLNSDTIDYTAHHPTRWRDVVFERWNTLSIRSNQPVETAAYKGIKLGVTDSLKNYEYTLVGDRHYYSYRVDQQQDTLFLTNRNPNDKNGFILHIARPDSSTIYLKGTDQQGDSLTVKLDKIDKKYLIEEVKKVGRSTLGYSL